MPDLNQPEEALKWLRRPEAIRKRCGLIYEAAQRGELRHFALEEERLGPTADFVLETIRQAYPALDVPYHSRWRHFDAGGRDRWGNLAARLQGWPDDEIARVRIDLAVTSVLLDAGAGADWRYREADTGHSYARSEGLAVASFHAFTAGLFSDRPDSDPLRADAGALSSMTVERLAEAFQAGPRNPLVGLEGRASLLQRLSAAMQVRPDLFGGEQARIGGLFDSLRRNAEDDVLPASSILEAILTGLGPIWPGRETLAGSNLGDVWRHPAVQGGDLTDGLVPFHKLSQWLTYSLVEPIQAASVKVIGVEDLTGLAEYRNGGLFLDMEVLHPKHDGVLAEPHEAGSELVVEWRALTLVLLDRLAARIREMLGLDAVQLPLAKVLEGGSWSAGRRIAAQKREGGPPPITVVSDGTVF